MRFSFALCSAAAVFAASATFGQAAGAAGTFARIPEGTSVMLKYNDNLSSATSSQGDSFTVTVDQPVTLGSGFVIPAGYRGVGEVTSVAKGKPRMFSTADPKPGQLNVRIDDIRIGATRIPLRLAGPVGLTNHGNDVEIERDQIFEAVVDKPVDIPLPLDPPP